MENTEQVHESVGSAGVPEDGIEGRRDNEAGVLATAVLKKSHFAAEISEGDSFDDVFLVDEISSSLKKNKQPYWTLVLRDRTGMIKCKVWDAKSWINGVPETNLRGTWIKIRAAASLYNNNVELTARVIRPLDPMTETVAVEDFVPVGPRDRFKQIADLREVFEEQVQNSGLRAVCLHVFDDARLHIGLRDAPAAKGHHHAYTGGLIDHVSSLVGLALKVCEHYVDLNQDMILAACLFHDLGKTRELQWDKFIGYTVEGQVVGHVMIGMEMLDCLRGLYYERSPHQIENVSGTETLALEWAKTTWDHLRHMIASHHGRLDWGAAKTPMTREACVFHLLDMLDSRNGIFEKAATDPVDSDGFTTWNRSLEGLMWRP